MGNGDKKPVKKRRKKIFWFFCTYLLCYLWTLGTDIGGWAFNFYTVATYFMQGNAIWGIVQLCIMAFSNVITLIYCILRLHKKVELYPNMWQRRSSRILVTTGLIFGLSESLFALDMFVDRLKIFSAKVREDIFEIDPEIDAEAISKDELKYLEICKVKIMLKYSRNLWTATLHANYLLNYVAFKYQRYCLPWRNSLLKLDKDKLSEIQGFVAETLDDGSSVINKDEGCSCIATTNFTWMFLKSYLQPLRSLFGFPDMTLQSQLSTIKYYQTLRNETTEVLQPIKRKACLQMDCLWTPLWIKNFHFFKLFTPLCAFCLAVAGFIWTVIHRDGRAFHISFENRSKAMIAFYYIIGCSAYFVRTAGSILYLSRLVFVYLVNDSSKDKPKPSIILFVYFFFTVISKGIVLPETYIHWEIQLTNWFASKLCLCNIECCIWEKLRQKDQERETVFTNSEIVQIYEEDDTKNKSRFNFRNKNNKKKLFLSENKTEEIAQLPREKLKNDNTSTIKSQFINIDAVIDTNAQNNETLTISVPESNEKAVQEIEFRISKSGRSMKLKNPPKEENKLNDTKNNNSSKPSNIFIRTTTTKPKNKIKKITWKSQSINEKRRRTQLQAVLEDELEDKKKRKTKKTPQCCKWSNVLLNFIILWWAASPFIGFAQSLIDSNYVWSNGFVEPCSEKSRKPVMCRLTNYTHWKEDVKEYYHCARTERQKQGEDKLMKKWPVMNHVSYDIYLDWISLKKPLWLRFQFRNDIVSQFLMYLNFPDFILGFTFTVLWFILRGYERKPMAIVAYVSVTLSITIFMVFWVLIDLSNLSEGTKKLWTAMVNNIFILSNFIIICFLIFLIFMDIYACVGCCLTKEQRHAESSTLRSKHQKRVDDYRRSTIRRGQLSKVTTTMSFGSMSNNPFDDDELDESIRRLAE